MSWHERGAAAHARWRSADGHRPPARIVVVDDELDADRACRLAAEGAGLLWRGDFHNARQLLDAMRRRVTRVARRRELPPAQEFHRQRQDQARASRLLGSVLVELGPGYALDLRRAPSVDEACREVFGPPSSSHAVVSLRELSGLIGAHRWRHRGIAVAGLDGRIHPHYGVFAPTRTDYVELFARAPLPAAGTAFDIGTGTGVLAAILLQKGIPRVVATDVQRPAVDCARDNLDRLGFADRASVLHRDLFPPGRSDLIVCNPPWVPVAPRSPLEAGVFDQRGAVVSRFVRQLPDHLTRDGEAWLLMSDLPELLGLRAARMLPELIENAGLTVRGRRDTPSTARRRDDAHDRLSALRRRERITLWTLARR